MSSAQALRRDYGWMLALICAVALLRAPVSVAQEQAVAAVERQVEHLVAAMNAMDLATLLSGLHPQAVVTWQHGGVALGHDGVRQYWDSVFGGAQPRIQRLTTRVVARGGATFPINDLAITYGTLFDHYELSMGTTLDLTVHWSAALRRSGVGWQIIALHFSVDPFDNAILQRVRGLRWYAGMGGIALGGLGIAVVSRCKRRRVNKTQWIQTRPNTLT